MNRLATAALSLATALLTFFLFPGHTWLQQDTQIYAPILEHERDPSVLRNDLVAVERAHLAFTLYDETARFLRAVTGLSFQTVLAAEQIAARALGVWGLWMLAGGGVSGWLVALITSLGYYLVGPAVLTVEYEPSPRAIALPLVICAMGLFTRAQYLAAGIAGAVALLYHVPTALPFWAVYAVMLWGSGGPLGTGLRGTPTSRSSLSLIPLAIALPLLAAFASTQVEPGQTRAFFSRITPLEEQIQRIRTGYVWISEWSASRILTYVLIFAAAVVAFWRIRSHVARETRWFLLGLATLGIASMPISWLLLEHWKWALMPQLQPMRLVLFGALAMQFGSAVAGTVALRKQRRIEAAAWFALAYLLPLTPLNWSRAALWLSLSIATAFASRFAPAVAVAAFFAIPYFAGVQNYPHLHSPELEQLSDWARTSTSKDAVFLFADAPRSLEPGIFRAEALRAVYVDWKSGGQVNFFHDFAELWWFRWQQTLVRRYHPEDLPRYEALGVSHVVLLPAHRLDRPPLFENSRYLVYTASPALQSK